MEKEASTGRGYRIAVSGMKTLIKILLIVCIAIALILLSRRAYRLGYQVFYQQPVDKGDGREITINITADMSVTDIGEMLKNAGLLEEEPVVFRLQELLSDYHNKIVPGTYTLRTGMTADEMLRVISGEGDEEQNDGTTQQNGSPKEIV
ncbi:MAG: aminodeoxychorismate lyase [Eubacterium sp.]|nr:aminodeoxychorismate lyase [Eubacterium sp.]